MMLGFQTFDNDVGVYRLLIMMWGLQTFDNDVGFSDF